MVSPETRYWLRLESGDRQGEKVSIPPTGLTVGRRPENTLRLAETSVSGRHAELVIVGEGVLLRDLGSTNGTKVGAERIEEQRLAHGDLVLFGNARAVFLDGRLEEPAADGEALGSVSQERLASAGRRSIWGLVGVLVLAGGAFAAWTFLGGKESGAVAAKPVIEIEGNKIADGSFEDAERPLDWETSEAAPTVFYRDPAFSNAGAFGLGADLEADAWSLTRSPKIDVRARRSLHLRASLSADGGAGACIGVELDDSKGASTPYRVWGPAVRDTGGFEPVELVFDTVAGYDEARVFVEASAEVEFGTVALDDVSLVDGPAQGRPAAALLEYAAYLHGSRATSASLKLGDELILGGIRVRAAGGGGGLPRWPAATLAVEATKKGMAFRTTGGPLDAELAFLVNPAATDELSNGDSVVAGWIATTGPDGFRSYSSDFEQEEVTGLLLGRGINLLRFGFAQPVKVVARLAGNGLHVTAGLGALDAFDLQLSFQEERGAAMLLSQEAADAERARDFGKALAAWQSLLDTVPFESELVARASAERARLLQEGMQKLTVVGQELDRASFFVLADLYRQCRASAAAIGAAYAGSEVDDEAARLVLRIDAELALFDSQVDALEKEQLEAILGVIEGEEWKGLAAHVREYLDRKRGN